MRHLEFYGYIEQEEFYGVNPTSMQADINSKTVSVEEREKDKYTIVQGGNDVGEIDTVSVIDHAKVVTVVNPDTGEEEKVLRIYFIADEQEAEETGQYCDVNLDDIRDKISFEDTDTIDFNTEIKSGATNVTADLKDGSISQDKLTDEFSNVINEKAEKSELVMVESDEPGIVGVVKHNDEPILKIDENGILYLYVEGDMVNVNEILGELTNETYEPNSSSNTGNTDDDDDYGFTG